jgi:hypothetical protein
MGISGQPFPEDIQLRDQASEIAKQFFKGSPIYKFYNSLVEYSQLRERVVQDKIG